MNIPITIESAHLINNRKRKLRKLGTLFGTGWQEAGDDAKTIRDSLIARLERQEKFNRVRRYLIAKDTTFCLYYADGWQYDMVRQGNERCPSACLLNVQTEREAFEMMERHAKQYAE